MTTNATATVLERGTKPPAGSHTVISLARGGPRTADIERKRIVVTPMRCPMFWDPKAIPLVDMLVADGWRIAGHVDHGAEESSS
jgi:hypothetical protein